MQGHVLVSRHNPLVCIDVVQGIEKTLTDADRKDLETIEGKIASYCKQKKIGAEQKKIVRSLWLSDA